MQAVLVVAILIQLIATAWSVVELRRQRDWRMGVFTVLLAVMVVYRLLALNTPRGPDPLAETVGDVTALATTTFSILALVVVSGMIREKQRAVESLQAGEQQLRHSEAQLRRERDLSDSIINALPGVFYLIDENERFRRWNHNFEVVTGYSAAEMAERHPLDFFTGEDQRQVAQRIEQVFQTGKSEVEADFVAKNGERTAYYFNGVRTAVDGRPCLLGMGIDISTRRAAEAALQESQERLQLFITHAPAALAMFDRAMQYLAVSRRWLSDYGLGNANIIGQSHYDIFPEIPEHWKVIHSRGLKGEVIRAEEDRFDRMDGTVQWLRWEVRPWYGFDETVGGIVIFTEDISGRKQAETERERLLIRETVARTDAELTRQQLANTLERISDAFVALDRDWRYTYVNEKAAQIFGRRREELIGKHIWTEFPEGVGRSFHLAYKRAVAEQVPIEIEEYYAPYDRWFENRIYPSPDGLSIAFHDITERKRVEVALRESEERLRLALDAAQMGTFDWDVPNGRITWSRWHEELWGFQPGEFGGTYEAFSKRVHREDLPGVNAEVTRCVAAHEQFVREFRVVWPDGSIHWIFGIGEFAFDADGRPDRMRGVVKEVTDRKQAEEALRVSEARLRAIFDTEPECVKLLGSDGTLLEMNPAGLRMIEADSLSQVQNRCIYPLVAPEYRSAFEEFNQKTFAGTSAAFEFQVISLKGARRWLETHATPLRDAAGRVVAALGITRDITARKRTEGELRASRERLATLSRQLITAQETERRHLARELHDEIGQVLTAVHISLQQARRVCPPDAWSRLDETNIVVDRAIQQVRAMSLNLRPAMLDDFGLVAALRWHVEQQQRPECPIELNITCCGLPLPLELTSACYRIVQEALTNVRRHARARHAWVELVHTPEKVCLRVQDDGAGCDTDHVRERAVAGRSFGVLGMRERVELLGGCFRLNSVPGQGTTVEVEFPVPQEDNDGEEPEAAGSSPAE